MASLVPVDHDPFAPQGGAGQPQQAMPQPQGQPQGLASGFGPNMSPERLMRAEMAGLVAPGAAKIVTDNPSYQIAQRRAAADQAGLQKGDPARQQYELTGAYPKIEKNYPAIQKKQDEIDSIDVTMADAKKAKELANQALTGFAPSTRAWLGSIYDDPASVATQRYENMAGQLSQQIAKSLSGARVNKFEQQTQKDLIGGLSKGKEARKATINDILDILQEERDAKERQSELLRNGELYKPQAQRQAKSVINGFQVEEGH